MANRLLHTLSLWFYQLGFVLFGLGYLAGRRIRGRPLPGIRERLALYPPLQGERRSGGFGPIWVHLVSVGEAVAARPLIEELRRRFPDRGWVITTVTATGRKVAESLIRPGKDHLFYLPWDLAPVVRQALRAIRPAIFLSFETELWPVLFLEMARHGVPIGVVNGRISPAAYGRYLWIRPWMQAVLSDVGFFFTQSPQDARRYAAIGAAKDRIAVTGNLKWDVEIPEPAPGLQPDQLRELLGFANGTCLWTAGSTHPGEERAILAVYLRLQGRFPALRLLIAPRHPERAEEVERLAAGLGLSTIRKSRWGEPANRRAGEKAEPVILLDTLGELTAFYGISEVVFVGGSLVPHGGHNLIEPAALSRPILSGPHLQNFQAISESLTGASAMNVVRTEQELENGVARVLQNPGWARELGARARALVDEHRGAARRTAEMIALKWGSLLAGKG